MAVAAAASWWTEGREGWEQGYYHKAIVVTEGRCCGQSGIRENGDMGDITSDV
jgi:hypothetical protein